MTAEDMFAGFTTEEIRVIGRRALLDGNHKLALAAQREIARRERDDE